MTTRLSSGVIAVLLALLLPVLLVAYLRLASFDRAQRSIQNSGILATESPLDTRLQQLHDALRALTLETSAQDQIVVDQLLAEFRRAVDSSRRDASADESPPVQTRLLQQILALAEGLPSTSRPSDSSAPTQALGTSTDRRRARQELLWTIASLQRDLARERNLRLALDQARRLAEWQGQTETVRQLLMIALLLAVCLGLGLIFGLRRHGSSLKALQNAIGAVWDGRTGAMPIGREPIDLAAQLLNQTATEHQRVRAQHQTLINVLQALDEAVLLFAADGRNQFANAAAVRMFGLGEPAVRQTDFAQLIASRLGGNSEAVLPLRDGARRDWLGETWLKRDNGERIPVLMSVQVLPSQECMLMLRDLSLLKQAASALRESGRRDAVTGQLNRPEFIDRISMALARARRDQLVVFVLFIWMDKLDEVRLSHGESAVETVLREICHRATAEFGESTVICRHVDSIQLLLDAGQETGSASELLRRAQARLAEPIRQGQEKMTPSTRFGIASFPHHATDAGLLVLAAELAARHAAWLGMPCQEFRPDLSQAAQLRIQLEHDLRVALETRQISLQFQPEVDMRSGEVIAAEALARWQHPKLGEISPADFVPLAESMGLIQELGGCVLEQALMMLKRLQNNDSGTFARLRIAVNVSALQLRQRDFVEALQTMLARYEVAASSLELELTESAVQTPAVAGNLRLLHELGHVLTLDDFGTGYSSLSTLRELPFDRLKIDRSFVRDAIHDARARAMVLAIQSMASALGIETVAEGVELQSQMDFLHSIECYRVQGYGVSLPLSARDLVFWLKWRSREPGTSVSPSASATPLSGSA